MSRHRPLATTAPFDLDSARFLFAPDGWPFPILRRSRRTITIGRGPRLIRLCRRNLEQFGADTAGHLEFRITTYRLPDEAAEGENHDSATR